MLTSDKQNERRKNYYELRGELITASMEYGDALHRREKQPSFWHHCTVASERKQKAKDAFDTFLAEFNVTVQDKHRLMRTLMFTCQELAAARYRHEASWYIEEKTIERQTAKDELNTFVLTLIKNI